MNIQGSRGCYGACTFCHIGPFYGGTGWRGRSPENIAAEIDELINQRGARDFYFTDPNFFGPGERGQQRALQLALLLKPKKIRFGIEARVNNLHEKTIKALTEAGLHQILIGLESGSDQATTIQIVLKGTPAYRRLLEEGRLEVNPALPYEGRTFPADGRAAVLARIMRGITNRIFLGLAGI